MAQNHPHDFTKRQKNEPTRPRKHDEEEVERLREAQEVFVDRLIPCLSKGEPRLPWPCGSMAGERRTILHAGFLTVTCHSRQRSSMVNRVVRSTSVPIAELGA